MGELAWQNHVDFIVQLGVLAGTLYGYYTYRKSQRKHSKAFLAVTAVNTAAIFLLMTPRLLDHIPEISLSNLDVHATLILTHSTIGAVAAIVSVALIITWGMVDFKLGKCRRQDLMALTFITWVIAAGVGIFGYLRHTFGWLM